MSLLIRVAIVGAILALVVAPAAGAASSAQPAKAEAAKSAKAKKSAKARKAAKAKRARADARNSSRKLRKAITSQRMFKHLQALDVIADEHGGNRASGFEGYGASAQYVLNKLRDAGYKPTVQVFSFVTFEEISEPVLREVSPFAKTYTQDEFATMSYSASGDTGEKQIVPIDVNLNPVPAQRTSTSGCEDTDFAGFPAGAIALMQRGTCTFAEKVVNAQEAQASGAIIFNQGNNEGRMDVVFGTLGETAQDGQPDPADVTIPAVGISYPEGERLANESDPTIGQIIVNAESDRRMSSNILADTASGDPDNVTIMGAHLDSVPEGPGINDNGSGSAFLLETALQMKKQHIRPENRVRFAWWGAEESGLVGATRYVEAISNEAFAQIAANLNFDMLASPNHAKFVYDGDFSDTPPPATAPDVNPGAAYIERVFVNYFDSVGEETEPTAFDGRSDYKPFQDNGVAAGGLFSGAEVAKSQEQFEKWGGQVGVPFDPNYHEAGDDITNLDLEGYEVLADGGAHTMAILAEDRNLRDTLAGGATAARKRAAKRLSRARRAALAEYRGELLAR